MNYDTLIKLHQTRPAARRLFDSIGSKGVEEGRTTVDELIDSGEVSRRQAITVLRDLADAGCGEFKVGRKGHPSRLEWAVDPVEVIERVVSEASGELGEELASDEEHEGYAEPSPPANEAPLLLSPPAQGALDLGDATERERQVPRRPRQRRSQRASALIDHSYVLRPDMRVSLQLPDDLTPREAEVLAAWVRNLSFER
jgi:hypothetical protein